MIVLVLLGLLASCGAMPYFCNYYGAPWLFPYPDDFFHQRFFQDNIFSTRSFLDEMRRGLLSTGTFGDDFVNLFPSSKSMMGINGDVYRITIPLRGFEKEEIAVKVKKGMVMIRAIHKQGGYTVNSYMDTRTLPAYVNEFGTWTYENDVLKIEFPLIKKPETTPTEATQAPHRREYMEPVTDDPTRNVDVGVDRGVLGKESEQSLLTNEVPRRQQRVQATPYAADLKDEVKFEPIRQVK